MIRARISIGIIIIRPAILTSTSSIVALDGLVINPNIIIFALPQASIFIRKSLSINSAALEILRRYVYIVGNVNRMLIF